MEIRRLREEDLPQLYRLNTVVFNNRRDFSKEEYKQDPLASPAEWSWGVFDKGKLLSGMTEIKYLMQFDGHRVPMSGIAGVGTFPEARKGGLVKAIFEKLLSEAYQEGVVFSCLAPFSYSYYRQFGYEVACARTRLMLPLRNFSHLKIRGEFTQIFPGDDCSALAEVHRKYIEGINHGICRDFWPDNTAWKVFSRNDPYATGWFLYLWRNEEGEPGGYIKYEVQKKDDGNIVYVSDLAFVNPDALQGVLSIIGVLGAQIEKFQWLMPSFLDSLDFLSIEWDFQQQIVLRDMTRIINVKRALELMRRPTGEGEYIIEVDDKLIPANKGKFLVEYGPEGSRVSLSQREAHIRCDIPILSQLVTGYRTLENALFSRPSGLEVLGNRETLDRVFTQRPQHLTEYF